MNCVEAIADAEERANKAEARAERAEALIVQIAPLLHRAELHDRDFSECMGGYCPTARAVLAKDAGERANKARAERAEMALRDMVINEDCSCHKMRLPNCPRCEVSISEARAVLEGAKR